MEEPLHAVLQGTGQAINLLKAYKNNLTERSGPVFLSEREKGGKCMSQSINITDLTNITGFFLFIIHHGKWEIIHLNAALIGFLVEI